jgi:hypothetical protein
MVKTANRPYRLPKNINTIIIGDSHTKCALNAKLLTNTANLSMDREPYMGSYYKIKKICKDNPQIKNVVLGFSYHNFSSYYDDFILGDDSKVFTDRYLQLMSFYDYMKLVINRPKALKSLSCVLNPFKERYVKAIVYDSTGVQGFKRESMEKRLALQFKGKANTGLISEIQTEYFNKTIKYCKDKKIRLILVNTPLHEEYAKQLPAELKKLFNKKLAILGLDYIDMNEIEYADSMYMPDGDHININGLKRGTEYFKENYSRIISK